MNIVSNPEYRIEKSFPFRIPIAGGSEILIKPGDNVYYDDIILESESSVRTKKIDLSGVFSGDLTKLVQVLHGEVVSIGDLLVKSNIGIGGMIVREIRSPIQGIIDLSELGESRIIINSVKTKKIRISGINGIAKKIIPDNKIVISTDVILLNAFVTIGTQRVIGRFEFLHIERDQDLHSLTDEYNGSILYVDSLVDLSFIKKADALGIKAIVCPGIDIDQFASEYKTLDLVEIGKHFDLNIFIVTGFGVSSMYKKADQILRKNTGMLAQVDKSLFALSLRQKIHLDSSHENFSELKKGDLVRIYESNLWGKIGTVGDDDPKDGRINISVSGKFVNIHINNLVKI